MNFENLTTTLSPSNSCDTEPGLVDDTCPPINNFFVLFQKYYIPVIVSFGLVGNLLSCTVFLTTHLRMRSSSYYLAALAMADFGFLSVLLIVYLSNETSFNLFNKHGWCQCFVYVSSVCSTLSVWLIVAFTVERFIAVQYPLQRPRMCTVSRAKSIVMILTIVALGAHSYAFITAGMVRQQFYQPTNNTNNSTSSVSSNITTGTSTTNNNITSNETVTVTCIIRICELREEYVDVMRIVTVIDTVVSLIGPVFLIVTMNAMIARNLIMFRRQFLRQQEVDETSLCNTSTTNMSSPAPLTTAAIPLSKIKKYMGSNDDMEPTQSGSTNKRNSSYRSSQPCKNTTEAMRARRKSKSNSSEQLPRCIHISTSGRTKYQDKSQQNITKMLLLISTVFILLNLPSYAIRMYVFFFYEIRRQRAPDVLWCIQQNVMVLYYTNFSINFMLYAVCGATFRRCLIQLIQNRFSGFSKMGRTCCKMLHLYKKPEPQSSLEPEVIPLKALRG